MADEGHEGGGSGSLSELLIFLGALALLVLFYFVSGAAKRAPLEGLFVQSPLAKWSDSSSVHEPSLLSWLGGTGTSNNDSYTFDASGQLPDIPALSSFTKSAQVNAISIQSSSGAYAGDPSQEFITIYSSSSNKGSINISGWQVRSPRTGNGAVIGSGTQIPTVGRVGSSGSIELQPGDSAIIATGRSPIGVSFRENSCVGYLSQFQSFAPPLSQSCPFPTGELSSRPDLRSENACVQAVQSWPPCEVQAYYPQGVSNACSDFLTQRFTYNGCVDAHKGDRNFTKPQWRIFLNQSRELWDNQSDIIVLLDAQGHLVSATSY